MNESSSSFNLNLQKTSQQKLQNKRILMKVQLWKAILAAALKLSIVS